MYKAVNDGVMYCLVFNPVSIPTLSMAYTTPSFVAMEKTVTRRNWQPVTIKRFQVDTRFMAVTSNYGGEALGIGRITENPFKQPTGKMDLSMEYTREGFSYMDDEIIRITGEADRPLLDATLGWKKRNEILSVVPFEVIEVFPGMEDKYTTDEQIKRCIKALEKAIA